MIGLRKSVLGVNKGSMATLARHLGAGVTILVTTAFTAGCAGPGQYVWFERIPPEAQSPASEYVIEPGDVVNIRVLGHDEMGLRQRVRPDGRLALLLIGDVDVSGKRPSALRAELEGRLKDYIVSPSVVVNVDEIQPFWVVLLGEVSHQGAFPIDHDPTLAHALALGGGLTEFASRDSIFVVRDRPAPARIRFTYDGVSRNVGRAGEFQLHPGDVVEVE